MFCQKTCHFCFSNGWAQTAFILIGTKVTEKYMCFQAGVPTTAFSKAGKQPALSYAAMASMIIGLRVSKCFVLCRAAWFFVGEVICALARWVGWPLPWPVHLSNPNIQTAQAHHYPGSKCLTGSSRWLKAHSCVTLLLLLSTLNVLTAVKS